MSFITDKRIVPFLVVLAFCIAPCPGQSGKAELYGTVRDASGLPVIAATVTAVEQATQVEFTTRSTAEGTYHLLGLPSGFYRLTVEKEGFQTHARSRLQVRIGDRLSIGVRLAVGDLRESVDVVAETPLLDMSGGKVSSVIETLPISALPLNGRNFIPLVATLPGVALPRDSAFPRLNGSRPRTNEYIYDGISVLQPEPGQVAFYPVIDAIAELRVDLNSYSAEYGRSNGGVVLVQHKSGTNEFHGSLVEFFRHENLNARNLFATSGPKPVFRRNQFGFVVGGPVVKNQTFFFADYQGSRVRTGRVRISTVPTSLQRSGIFSEAIGGAVPAIYDPQSTRSEGGIFVRDPFPGNRIPAARFDSVAQEIVTRYPLPNVRAASGAETTANNFRRSGNEETNQDQFGLRLDHYLANRHRLFGRYTYLRDAALPVAPLPDGSGQISSGPIGDSRTRADALVVEHGWNLSPSVLNQARFGYTRRAFLNAWLRDGSEELPAIPNLHKSAFGGVLPAFQLDGYQQMGPTSNANSDFATSVTQFVDTLSMIRGAHSLKAGVDIRLQRLDILQPPYPGGQFQFTAPFTGLPGDTRAGHSVASLLLGQVESFHIDVQEEKLQPRATNAEFFLQDDWKVAPRFSVNVGLRYTLNFPSTEANDQGAVFHLDTQTLRLLGQDGFPRTARKLHKENLGPRFGLAWQAAESFAVRAGYGLAWFEMAGITTPFTTPFFPFIQSVGQASLDNVSPAFLLAAGPTVVPVPPGPQAGLGQGAFGVDRDNGSGYAQQWNFTLQKTLPGEVSFQVGYLGSKVTRLGVPDTNLNQLHTADLALGPALLEEVENPFLGEIPAWSPLGQPTLPRAQLLRMFPRFTNVSLYRNNIGHSVYHGLQASIEKRLSRGLTFTLAYTFSKLIDDASSVFSASVLTGPVANYPVADSHDRSLERDVSRGDIPHVFSASYVYDLPFGRGRAVSLDGWRNALFGGWQIAGIVRAQSGIPLPVEQQPNFNSFAGFGVQRPDRVNNPELPQDERTTGRYFRSDAFALAPQFTIGNSSRHPVYGPGYFTLDAMVGKTFSFMERFRAEIRLEAFNATNTAPWGEPNGRFGAPGFGSITSAGDPRVFEAVVKLHF